MLPEASDIILFVDWVGLSLRLKSDPIDIPNHQWREYSATNVWGKRRILYNEYGDKVLTLLSEPRSNGFLHPHAALLEVENQWLYHGGGVDMVLNLLGRSCFFEVLGFSRLDLAVDFTPNATQADIIRGLSEGRFYVAGKRNGSGFWSTNNSPRLSRQWCGEKIPHSQSWGHKTSDIKWKLYYKTKELVDAAGGQGYDKPYIVDQWRQFGLDETNVWRLEVSIKHGNGFLFDGRHLDLDMLKNERDLIFDTLYTDKFKVKVNEGHLDRSNDKQVEFLDIYKSMFTFKHKPPARMAEHNGRLHLMRMLVKELDDECVLLDKYARRDVVEHVGRLIRRDNLENYFHAMTGLWYHDWCDRIEVAASGRWGVRDAYAVPLDDSKRSHAVEDRTYDVPRPRTFMNMPLNDKFDSQDSGAWEEWKRWLNKSLGMEEEPPKPNWNLDFGESPPS